jgi:hypothetical protein
MREARLMLKALAEGWPGLCLMAFFLLLAFVLEGR